MLRRLANVVIVLVLLLGGLVLMPSARAATFNTVTFDAVSFDTNTNDRPCTTAGGSVTDNQLSWTHTTDTTRGDRLLVVFVRVGTSDSITGATFAGRDLLLLRSDTLTNNHVLRTYYLRNPSTGTVTITYDSGGDPIAIALSFYNVDQSSTFTTNVGQVALGISGTDSISVPSRSEDLVLDALLDLQSLGTYTLTAGTGQTNRADRGHGGGGGRKCLVISTLAAAAGVSTTMSWSGTSSNGADGDPTSRGVHAALSIHPTGISGGGGLPGGGGQPAFPADLDAACPLSAFDWLVATPISGHRDVTVYDGRSEAALAVLYIVAWGDGKQDTKVATPINHTYQKDDIYQITVRVQYRTGLIEIFVTQLDTRGNNCALQKFANEYMGILLMLAVLLVIAATIVIASRRRLREKTRRLFSKAFLWLGVGILATVLMIAIYALLARIPI